MISLAGGFLFRSLIPAEWAERVNWIPIVCFQNDVGYNALPPENEKALADRHG